MKKYLLSLCLFLLLFSHEISARPALNISFYKGSKVTAPKNYELMPTAKNQEDLRFLINTLGFASLAKLVKEKSSMKRAGDRLSVLHPLRFIEAIFQDEKMKAGFHSLRSRSYVWKEFFPGIAEGFEEESQKNNMNSQIIHDFANNLNLNGNLLMSLVEAHDWEAFIDFIIDNVPRDSNKDRYIW